MNSATIMSDTPALRNAATASVNATPVPEAGALPGVVGGAFVATACSVRRLESDVPDMAFPVLDVVALWISVGAGAAGYNATVIPMPSTVPPKADATATNVVFFISVVLSMHP
jgi:hypothetical protein